MLSFSFRRLPSPETGERAYEDLKKVMSDPATHVRAQTLDGQTEFVLTGEDGRVHSLRCTVAGKRTKIIVIAKKISENVSGERVKRRFSHLSSVV